MFGILKEKNEIEKMQEEFKILVSKSSPRNPQKEKSKPIVEELVLEECEA